MKIRKSDSYRNAEARRIPIVAFESAIISHGLPHPDNIKLIEELHETAGCLGIYLAVIWLDEGYVKVGFDNQELKKLASDENRTKVSGRDIPYVLATGLTGGTTVSATLLLARRLGLQVFATGGLGGVHYRAETSFDISNDIYALSRNPLVVVSAGIKSVLDVAKTLELFETFGIPIFGYQTDTLPLFYSRSSEYSIKSVQDVKEICRLYDLHRTLDLSSSMIVANPVPEEWSIPAEDIDCLLEKAIREAEKHAISGSDVTPFLLHRLSQSNLNTVKTNIELVKNNVRLAADIAIHLKRYSENRESND